MKWAIISSRELMGSRCWKPARFLGGCHACTSVEKCGLPQADFGRLRLAQLRMAKAEEAIEQAQRERDAVREEIEAQLQQIGKWLAG